MPSGEIKIVKPRPNSAETAGEVDYVERDFWEWGVYAYRHNQFRCHCEVGEARFHTTVEAVVIIAAPDQRVAVWYGRVDKRGARTTRERHGRKDDTASPFDGAMEALENHGTTAPNNVGLAAATYWDKTRTRGGDRDVKPLALAACRVLHAAAFGYKASLRDELLAEFATLGCTRPPTPHLLRASDNELLAASALLSADQKEGVRPLLARKGVTGT